MSSPMMPGSGRGPVPAVPTLPDGTPVASFRTYLEAQRAVDHLSDEAFPVQSLTIVGDDLRMVERVTGRLTYGRVAMGGLLSGAWFGLFIGLLLSMFSGDGSGFPLIAAVLMGAAFATMFSLISYALSRGRRDFTSSSQIVATRYTVICDPQHAGRAREMLAAANIRSTAGQAPVAPGPGVVHGFPPPASPGPGGGGPSGAAPGAAPEGAGPRGSAGPAGPGTDGGAAGGPGSGASGAGAPGAPAATRPSSISSQYVTPDGRPRYGLRHEDLAADGTPLPEAVAEPGTGPTEPPGDEKP